MFQVYFYGHHLKIDENAREQYRDSPHFDRTNLSDTLRPKRPSEGSFALSSKCLGFEAGLDRRNEVRTFMGQSLSRRRRGHRQIASFLVGAALLIAGCSIVRTPSTRTASGLKPIDQAALQSVVDMTIKELLIPGAVVLLRTPQGDFTATYGTTYWALRTRPAPTPTSGSPRIPRR